MRSVKRAGVLALGLLGAAGGCVGGMSDENSGPDAGVTTPSDSGQTPPPATDSSFPDDTSVPDVSVPDASVRDTSVPDTSVPDTSVPDTSVADASDAGDAADAAGPVDASDAGDATDAGPVDAGTDGADAAVATVTISGGGNTKITLANGVPLYISDAHTVWTFGTANPVTYQNLPPALIGTVGNDTVNNNTQVTFTLSAATTCYLLRQVNWSSVSLVGWTQFDTAAYYFAGYDNGVYGTAIIYSQTFGPGSYNFSTFSGMNACAGQ